MGGGEVVWEDGRSGHSMHERQCSWKGKIYPWVSGVFFHAEVDAEVHSEVHSYSLQATHLCRTSTTSLPTTMMNGPLTHAK